MAEPHPPAPDANLAARYRAVRAATLRLCSPLAVEDCVVQSMPDASPVRWHLAHTTWFFETFLLREWEPGFRPHHSQFHALFNSYYHALGQPFPRHRRGLLSRPTVAEVHAYRAAVDERMERLFEGGLLGRDRVFAERVELGLEHEQQHQELILTDVKHALSQNPLAPAYRERGAAAGGAAPALGYVAFPGGTAEIGHRGRGFAFDNESPRHRALLLPFRLATRLVTNAEFAEFIADGGYRRHELWLSDGFQTANAEGWRAPLYWEEQDGAPLHFTLAGLTPRAPAEPVCHVSYYEADAYARWKGARLPTEAEWEVAAAELPVAGNFAESERFHPAPARGRGDLSQLFGDAWEWTASPYSPYPGYRPAPGAIGEYNGKFMCNQMVLRGGSCATPGATVRASYRNFFHPPARWQFTGIRLALDSE